jgi:DNA-binding transcriptional regulator GbsR (MarR family)
MKHGTQILTHLSASPDGMTATEISLATGLSSWEIQNALKGLSKSREIRSTDPLGRDPRTWYSIDHLPPLVDEADPVDWFLYVRAA